MGNYSSKFLFYNSDQGHKLNSPNSDQTINMEKQITPPPTRKLMIDPRSATAGIPRTPIEVTSTPFGSVKRPSALPKYLQRKQYLETDIDLVIPPLTPRKCFPKIETLESPHTPVSSEALTRGRAKTLEINANQKSVTEKNDERYKILGLDPRSPAADFDRTPILMPKSMERLKARSQENLSKRGSYDGDMFRPRFSYCESMTADSIPEIQALPHIDSNVDAKNTDDSDANRKSNSSLSSYSSSVDTISESAEEITVIKNPNINIIFDEENVVKSILSGSDSVLDEQDSFLSDEHKSSELENSATSFEKTDKSSTILTPCYDKIKIWSDPTISETTQDLVISKLCNFNLTEETVSEKPKEEIIILFDDDMTVKKASEPKDEGEICAKKKHLALCKKKKNIKPEMKSAIDEKKFTPENKKGIEVIKNRTPLGNRSNNDQRIQKVLAKSPQQLFRNKGIAIKMQQENTPPHRRSVAKYHRNGMQWDPDTTVII